MASSLVCQDVRSSERIMMTLAGFDLKGSGLFSPPAFWCQSSDELKLISQPEPVQQLKIYGDLLGKHILSERYSLTVKVTTNRKTSYSFKKIVSFVKLEVKVDA